MITGARMPPPPSVARKSSFAPPDEKRLDPAARYRDVFIGALPRLLWERVGNTALRYRDKDTYLGAVNYVLMTNLALLHVQQVASAKKV